MRFFRLALSCLRRRWVDCRNVWRPVVSSARSSTFYDRGKQGDVYLGHSDHRLELGEALRGMRHGMVPVLTGSRPLYHISGQSQLSARSLVHAAGAGSCQRESFMRGRLLRRLAWT